jgi:hypothetical protein
MDVDTIAASRLRQRLTTLVEKQDKTLFDEQEIEIIKRAMTTSSRFSKNQMGTVAPDLVRIDFRFHSVCVWPSQVLMQLVWYYRYGSRLLINFQ